MKNNYDDGTPGIVGTVLQNLSGHLLVRGDFFIDKDGKKIMLEGSLFAIHDVAGLVNFFEGDLIKIEKLCIKNLTEEKSTYSFSDLLKKAELELLNSGKHEFVFKGYIEKINIIGNDAAIRFHVISRINADGVLLRADKIISYYQKDNKQNNNFLTSVFSAPMRKALTLKYSRKFDQDRKAMSENVVISGNSAVNNAKTFLKKHC